MGEMMGEITYKSRPMILGRATDTRTLCCLDTESGLR